MTRPPHPGRTPAERRVLDEIGGGHFTPCMHPKVQERLLADGLIVRAGQKIIGRDRFGVIAVPEFDMPIAVHMQWCRAISFDARPEPERSA